MTLEAEFAFVWEAISTGQHNVAKSRARPAFEAIKKRFLVLERSRDPVRLGPLDTQLGRVSCTFVVNGEPVKRTLVAGQTLRDHVIGVLKQTKNDSDPGRLWEVRDALGTKLDLSRTVDSYDSLDQCPVIYVTLPVGAGGSSPEPVTQTASEAHYATYSRVRVMRTDYAALAEQVSQVFPLVQNRTRSIAQIVDNAVAALGLLTEAALRLPYEVARFSVNDVKGLAAFVLRTPEGRVPSDVFEIAKRLRRQATVPGSDPSPVLQDIPQHTTAIARAFADWVHQNIPMPADTPTSIITSIGLLRALQTDPNVGLFPISDVLLVSRALFRTTSSHASHEAARRLRERAMALLGTGGPSEQNETADPPPAPGPGHGEVKNVFAHQGLTVIQWAAVARALWKLLDDIDTLGDSMKPGTSPYFRAVQDYVCSRKNYLASFDGQTIVPVASALDLINKPASSDEDAALRVRLIQQVSSELRSAESSGCGIQLHTAVLDYLLRVAHPPVLNDLAERVAKLEAKVNWKTNGGITFA